ncbi:hypothetical protein ABIE62_002296 [Porphyrobacter sp. MBR-155]|jgi:hypothetical protein
MNHVFNHTLAVVAACVLAFGSIGAIVAVPPMQTHVPHAAFEIA